MFLSHLCSSRLVHVFQASSAICDSHNIMVGLWRRRTCLQRYVSRLFWLQSARRKICCVVTEWRITVLRASSLLLLECTVSRYPFLRSRIAVRMKENVKAWQLGNFMQQGVAAVFEKGIFCFIVAKNARHHAWDKMSLSLGLLDIACWIYLCMASMLITSVWWPNNRGQ